MNELLTMIEGIPTLVLVVALAGVLGVLVLIGTLRMPADFEKKERQRANLKKMTPRS